ncbi:PE-PPE domain-containing protein [Mycobacterium sp. pV006]|uniref:PE-PPE domain-containing protein n=1 Tax=Mycobacterium sp. pV006 TaxID=3238983 RepID=UPI00351BC210
MRSPFRAAAAALVSLFAVLLLGFTSALGPAGAGTALVVGGIANPRVSDLIMSNLLNKRFANDIREDIEWPAQAAPFTGRNHKTLGQSIAEGQMTLYQKILDSETPVTVVGLSAGSLVVDEVMRMLLDNPDFAPSKQDLTFVIVADSSRQRFINQVKYNSRFDYTYQPAPVTQYDVIVVTGEYDGFADFPDRPWNLLALINAYAGMITEHMPSAFADLDAVPDENITVDVNELGGKTTHYLVPAKTLPIVKLLPFLKSREDSLRARIEKAYIRNDDKSSAAASRQTAGRSAVVADLADAPAEKATEAPAAAVSDAEPQGRDVAEDVTEADVEAKSEVEVEADVEAEVKDVIKDEIAAEADTDASEALAAKATNRVRGDDDGAEASGKQSRAERSAARGADKARASARTGSDD